MNPSPNKRSLKDELLLLIREKKEVSFAEQDFFELEKWFRDAGILVRAEIAKNTAKTKQASSGNADLRSEKPAETLKVWLGIVRKILKIIVVTIGAIITILGGLEALHSLGWLEPIKAFIYRLLLHK